MSDTNVGMGMVPCKKGCTCNECTIERLSLENKELKNFIVGYEAMKDGVSIRINDLESKLKISVDALESAEKHLDCIIKYKEGNICQDCVHIQEFLKDALIKLRGES